MSSKSLVRQLIFRLLTPLSLMILGWILFVAGFAYAFFFVGLPYPDAPPETQIRMAYHNQISNRLLLTGLWLGIMGFVWLVGLQLLVWIFAATRRSQIRWASAKPPAHPTKAA